MFALCDVCNSKVSKMRTQASSRIKLKAREVYGFTKVTADIDINTFHHDETKFIECVAVGFAKLHVDDKAGVYYRGYTNSDLTYTYTVLRLYFTGRRLTMDTKVLL